MSKFLLNPHVNEEEYKSVNIQKETKKYGFL